MSYSRWIGSHWYTYYSAGSGQDINSQVLDICSVASFTYKELKYNINFCINRVQEKDPEATEEEIKELKGYIQEFIADVESDVGLKYYEAIKRLDLSVINDLLSWLEEQEKWDKQRREDLKKSGITIKEDETITSFNEALKVIYAEPTDLPLLMAEMQTDLGKGVLEQRLKNPKCVLLNCTKNNS
jgi:hypothetical protein